MKAKRYVGAICLTLILGYLVSARNVRADELAGSSSEVTTLMNSIETIDGKESQSHKYIPLFTQSGGVLKSLVINAPFADPEQREYNFLDKGFPSGQDVYLENQDNTLRLWIRAKNWVNSVALYGVREGKEFLLKAVNPSTEEEDNRVMIDGKLSSNSENYLASSAVMTLPTVGRVLRLNMPLLVTYGDRLKDNLDTIYSFDKLVVKFYEKEHAGGRSVFVAYNIKEALNIPTTEPTLKKIAILKRKIYDIVLYEYRSFSLDMRGIKISENKINLSSLFVDDFFVSLNQPIRIQDDVKMLQWLYDLKTKESVIRFAVLVTKRLVPRDIETKIYINASHNLVENYTVEPIQIQK